MRLHKLGNNETEIEFTRDGATYSILFSYNTPVAVHVSGIGYLRTEAYYSRTTSKHINQWIAGATATVVSQADIDKLIG